MKIFQRSKPAGYSCGLFLMFKDESAKEMSDRIRAEIKAENERNLNDPGLYLNTPKNIDGSLRESEREQIGA